MSWEPTPSQLGPVLADLDLAAPVALSELKGGNNRSFRVDLADGRAVVLKVYEDKSGKLPTGEVYASSFLQGLDLPVTRYLALDETRTRLPVRFAITNFLVGEQARTFFTTPGVEAVYRQMGQLLRTLHRVKTPAHGHFGESVMVATFPTNFARAQARLDNALSKFRLHGGDPVLADRLAAIGADRIEAATVSTGPVFAHDDMHPGNVLVARNADGSLRLSGLIDLGNAQSADAVWDLAKTLFICAHEAPESPPFIREGYGPIDHPDPEGALWFYTMMHRLTMWWWLRHVGVIKDGEHNALIDDLRAMADNPLSPSPRRGG